jgi:hypothetical protein
MAYTKYSLTPANNNAAPPDGAPEGMLPSAVNDTMRDMMAQIRDVGDGIRGGTYTMTAPVITGGSVTGSTINNSAIGGTTASTGAFTTLGATGVATFSAGTVSAPAITTTGDTNTGIFFPAADTIAFTEGGVEAMRIDSSGNVGIGNASPTYKLDISGTNPRIRLNETTGFAMTSYVNTGGTFDVGRDSSAGAVVGTAYAGFLDLQGAYPIVFRTNATERMRIDSSGNVGIGTTSPTLARLQVSQTSNTSGAIYAAAAAGQNGNAFAFVISGVTNGYNITNDGSNNIQHIWSGTGGSERMRIDSSGNLLVGTTSVNNSCKQTIQYGSGSNGIAVLTSENINGTDFAVFSANNAICGKITRVGTTSATVYTTTSDYRLKTVIGAVSNCGQRIDALKPIEYDFKNGGRTKGFLAHEFAEVYPDSVSGEKDAVDEEGKPIYQGMQASSSEVMADLIAEIQSLRKRVAQLESK